MKSYRQELTDQLMALDKKAEALGAQDVRVAIANILADMSEPEGKTNAQIAIPQIREKLKGLRVRHSEKRIRSDHPDSPEELSFDDVDVVA